MIRSSAARPAEYIYYTLSSRASQFYAFEISNSPPLTPPKPRCIEMRQYRQCFLKNLRRSHHPELSVRPLEIVGE